MLTVFASSLPAIANIGRILISCRMLAVILGSLSICQPLAYNWDTTLDGHCGNSVTLWICTGVLNIVTDLVVLLLPMPYLYSLTMASYKKAVLMVTFGLGLL